MSKRYKINDKQWAQITLGWEWGKGPEITHKNLRAGCLVDQRDINRYVEQGKLEEIEDEQTIPVVQTMAAPPLMPNLPKKKKRGRPAKNAKK
jgi:hypothetical protein